MKRNFNLFVKDPVYKVSMGDAKVIVSAVGTLRLKVLLEQSREPTNVPRAQQNSLKLMRPSWFSSIRRKTQRERVLLMLQKAQGSSREKSMLNCWKPSWYCSR